MKKTLASSLLALLLFTSLLTASAQGLYRWVDKDGRVTYSDTPPPKDAKSVQKKKWGDNVSASDDEQMPYAVKSAMQRNPIILYANNCGEPCDQARALLSKRGVPFANRNPETEAGAAEALKELIGALTVPTISIGQNNLIGFNEGAWASALDAAGYPKFNPNLRTQPKPANNTDKNATQAATATNGSAAAADINVTTNVSDQPK